MFNITTYQNAQKDGEICAEITVYPAQTCFVGHPLSPQFNAIKSEIEQKKIYQLIFFTPFQIFLATFIISFGRIPTTPLNARLECCPMHIATQTMKLFGQKVKRCLSLTLFTVIILWNTYKHQVNTNTLHLFAEAYKNG